MAYATVVPTHHIPRKTMVLTVLTLFAFPTTATAALHIESPQRRCILRHAAIAVLPFAVRPGIAVAASALPPDLNFITTQSGLQYADAKLGTGQPLTEKGAPVAIDYVMSTTGARYGTKIYSTAESGAPYRFKLGDGTTIPGLEEAIAGGPGVEPMRPGGVRRVIIPSKLAYQSLAQPIGGMQYQDCQEGKGVGPIPPVGEGTAGEYYQRFKNIYCNANRPYQPDLVMDVKLYGKR